MTIVDFVGRYCVLTIGVVGMLAGTAWVADRCLSYVLRQLGLFDDVIRFAVARWHAKKAAKERADKPLE